MSTNGVADLMAVAAVPFAMVAGTGVLVAKGVMWCGEKLKENYQAACKSFEDLAEREQKELLTHARDRTYLLSAMVEQFTTSEHLRTFENETASINAASILPEEQHILSAEIMRRMQEAIHSPAQAQQIHAQRKRIHAQQGLAEEIAASKGLVVDIEIQLATDALNGSLEEIKNARQHLSRARQNLIDTQVIRESNRRQANYILMGIEQELAILQQVTANQFGSNDQRFSSGTRVLQQALAKARQLLDNDQADLALREAQVARERLGDFKQDISAGVAQAQDAQRHLATKAQGKLNALSKIMRDALDTMIINSTDYTALQGELDLLQNGLRQAESTGNGAQLNTQLALVEPLARRVLSTVTSSQQNRFAHDIALTLQEIGFSGEDENTPPVQRKIGGGVRVTGIRNERSVDLTIEENGQVFYDFSGYTGNECEAEAEEVFKALRDKGIIIVDKDGERRLKSYSAEQFSPELLKDERFALHFKAIKHQGTLSMAIIDVLEKKMNMKVFKIVTEGSITIDAFGNNEGGEGIDYHIVLPGQGETKFRRNGEEIVVGNLSDPLQAALSEPAPLDTPSPSAQIQEDEMEDEEFQQGQDSIDGTA